MTKRAAASAVQPGSEAERRAPARALELRELAAAVHLSAAAMEALQPGADLLDVVRKAAGLASTMQREHRQMTAIIDAMLPPLETIPGPGVALQARRNAQARVALATEFGLLTAGEVAAASGSRASNPSATATRWRGQRRIFPVSYQGAQTYPGFQFDADGQPRPVIANVLAAVGDGVTGWELALWFVSNDGWLDGARPVDLLEAEPAAVVEAAGALAAGPAV